MTKQTWTAPRTDKLVRLHKSDLTAQVICDILNAETPNLNISRNAVIGKLHRLGYCQKAAQMAAKIISTKRPPAPEPVAVHVDDTPDTSVSLLDVREGQCRYLFDEPKHTCCGAPVVAGSYCERHAKACYQKHNWEGRAHF